MIVADSTPLIAFARIDELELLKRIVGRLLVPCAVWAEVAGSRNRTGATEIERATWIEVRSVDRLPLDLVQLLDRGEGEVIALAEQLGASEVVLDGRAARAVAIARQLSVVGTAGLLVRAKHRQLIPAVRPYLARMRQRGIRYGDRFLAEFLRRLGE